MAINTFSKFYYGHTVTKENRFIDFIAGPTYAAALNVGNYSLSEFVVEIQRAMNDVAGDQFTVSVNRDTRQITIARNSGGFNLLFGTGVNFSNSAASLIGFTSVDTGYLTNHTGLNGSGKAYLPQFMLQSYVPFEHMIQSVQSQVNESASGEIEVVNFGRVNMMKCNIIYITDIPQPHHGSIITNINGVLDAVDFLTYITTKAKIEFIPNIANVNVFTKCLLDSTDQDKSGTSFELLELYSRGLSYYYETGILTFRKVT